VAREALRSDHRGERVTRLITTTDAGALAFVRPGVVRQWASRGYVGDGEHTRLCAAGRAERATRLTRHGLRGAASTRVDLDRRLDESLVSAASIVGNADERTHAHAVGDGVDGRGA